LIQLAIERAVEEEQISDISSAYSVPRFIGLINSIERNSFEGGD